jgi:hypothetical protein
MSVINIGTAQKQWTMVAATNTDGALLGVGEYLFKQSLASPPTGVEVVTIPGGSDTSTTFSLMFYGKGGNGKVAYAQAWGITEVPAGMGVEYVGKYLFRLKLHMGAGSANSGAFASGPWYFIERIEVEEDCTATPPGVRFAGTAAGGCAEMTLDSLGFSKIVIQLTNEDEVDSSDEIGFLWRPL